MGGASRCAGLICSDVNGVDVSIALWTLASFAARNIEAARAGHRYNAFWMCDAAVCLVGIAILLRAPMLSAVSFIWLLPGTIIWFTNYIVTGGPWRRWARITGLAMHATGLPAATYAVLRNGYVQDAWKAALILQAVLFLFSWVALPAKENINAVRGVPLGWNVVGGGLERFAALALAVAVTFAFIGQLVIYCLAWLIAH